MAFRRRRRTRTLNLVDVWQKFVRSLEPPYELQSVLTAALDVLAALFPAEGYYAYVKEPSSDLLKLKLTRSATNAAIVGPNYAGLVQGGPVRQTPLEIPSTADPDACEIVGTKTDPFLHVSLGPQVALRAAVEAGRRVADGEREALVAFGVRARPLLEVILYVDALTKRLESRSLGATIQQRATELALGGDRVLGLVCRLGIEAAGATAGVLIGIEAGRPVQIWATEDGEALGRSLTDRSFLGAVRSRLVVWTAPRLPRQVAALPYQTLAALAFPQAWLFLACPERLTPTPHLKGVFEVLSRTVGQALLGRREARDASTYLGTLFSAVAMLDAADPHNQRHSDRVAEVAERIARRLGLPVAEVEACRLAGRLHDLGMVAVSLDLPLCQGALSETRRNLVRIHPTVGADLLAPLVPGTIAQSVVDGVRHHHERVDGLGYPDGLAGERIPLVARVVGVAETFVARTSNRSYRPGLTEDRALFEIERLAGTQLDGQAVDGLLRAFEEKGIVARAPER